MKTALLVLLLVLVTLVNVQHSSAQSLNRLFTTPAQRAQLDRIRLQSLQLAGMLAGEAATLTQELTDAAIEETGELIEDVSVVPEADVVYTLGGTVVRSDGSINIWINGAVYDRESLPRNMELLSPFEQGQIRISDPRRGTVYLLKPGQTLNLTTGELLETYQLTSGANDPLPVAPDQSPVPAGQP